MYIHIYTSISVYIYMYMYIAGVFGATSAAAQIGGAATDAEKEVYI